MSKTTANKLEANASLTLVLTEAIKEAAANGLTNSEIAAILARLQEIVEEED